MLEGYYRFARSSQQCVRIGVILPLTGNMAREGEEILRAYELARQIVVDQGGVNGKPIIFERGDSPDPSAAQQNARNMVGRDTKVVMGSLANYLGLAASSVVEEGGGTYFETTAVSEEFTNRGLRHVFRASTAGSLMGAMAIRFIACCIARSLDRAVGKMSVAIVYEPNWRLIAEAASTMARRYGMKVVLYADYDSKCEDFQPLVTRLKDAQPDVVLAGGWLSDSVALNRQSKRAGFWPKAWIGLSGGHSISEYAADLQQDAEGVFVINASSNIADCGLTTEGRTLKHEFLQRWSQRHPKEAPSGLAFEAFSNAWVLMHEALPNAKSMSPRDLKNALLSVDLPEGSLPNGSGAKFAADGSNQRAFYTVKQWRARRLTTVWGAVYRVCSEGLPH